MTSILECVPNFSEGRNLKVIDEIADAIQTGSTAKLINIHSDADHNRSVFTILGEPEPLIDAVFRGTEVAVNRIDLKKHHGTHPRIGAADVIPFIPLVQSSMQEAIRLAVKLAERIGNELHVPVFLYGEATTNIAHKKLSDLRRGGYESLLTKIGKDQKFIPDFGPNSMGNAGATAVGARPILIAYNIFLNSNNQSAAKMIAKSIRESSGGLPKVQALGMLVKDQAQVSMNLLDYQTTSLKTIYLAVEKLADAMSLQITHSELVGCLPEAALKDTSPQDLKIINFDASCILENHYLDLEIY